MSILTEQQKIEEIKKVKKGIINTCRLLIKAVSDLLRLRRNELMVLKICEERGLTAYQTKIIHDTIELESELNDKAGCFNLLDGSTISGEFLKDDVFISGKRKYQIDKYNNVLVDLDTQKAIHFKSYDVGICQFNNDWYWRKEQIIHPDIALNNPEKAVNVMIDQLLKGQIRDWYGYRRLFERS